MLKFPLIYFQQPKGSSILTAIVTQLLDNVTTKKPTLPQAFSIGREIFIS